MEKESENPFQGEESVEKSWVQVYAQKMWGGGKSYSSHINGSMKNECFGARRLSYEHEEELLDELLCSPLRIHMRAAALHGE